MVATPLGQGRPGSSDADPTSMPSAGQAGESGRPGAWRLSPAVADYMVAIDDGLLMVFGPEGDPLPPGALRAALDDDPDAMLALADGTQVAAAQVMVVLEAQASGGLGPGSPDAEAWIRAMLGVGPQPDEVAAGALQDELDGGQLTAFGNELMITMPGGGSILITEAKTARPASETIGLFLADGSATTIRDLIDRLRSLAMAADDLEENSLDSADNDLVLPDCWVRVESDTLVLDFETLGRVRLGSFEDDPAGAPQVTVFLPDGRAASMVEVLATLGSAGADAGPDDALVIAAADQAKELHVGSVGGGQGEHSEPMTIGPVPGDEGAAQDWSSDDGASPSHAISLTAHLPHHDDIEAEHFALAVVRGVPRGGALSAGIDNDDGTWLLSPAELDHLTLNLPSDALRPVSLPLIAIAVTSRDGALISVAGTLRLADAPSFPRKPFGRRSAPTSPDQPIRLAVERCVSHLEGIDAVVIRDVPAGASLSAGTYDPAIAGWVLRPGQLADLALRLAPDHPSDLTLTILGISLRPGAPTHPRVLGRLPVGLR